MHRVNRNAIIQFILVLTVIAVAVTPVLSDSPPGRGLSKTQTSRDGTLAASSGQVRGSDCSSTG